MWLFLRGQQNLNHMGCSDAIHDGWLDGWTDGRRDGWMKWSSVWIKGKLHDILRYI
jgi:hypothetical protein